MTYVLLIVVIPIVLLVWRFFDINDKEQERRELVKAIREELKEVRDDIIKEIRSK